MLIVSLYDIKTDNENIPKTDEYILFKNDLKDPINASWIVWWWITHLK